MSMTMIIFGGTSLHVRCRIIPAIHKIYVNNQLSENFQIIATARCGLTSTQYRKILSQYLKGDSLKIETYLSHIKFLPLDFLKMSETKMLPIITSQDESSSHFHIFFLSTSPAYYGTIVRNIGINHHHINKNDLIIIDNSYKQNKKSLELTQQTLLHHFSEEKIHKTIMTEEDLQQTLTHCLSPNPEISSM